MPSPLHKTFDLLTGIHNPLAVDLLIETLRIPNDEIRTSGLAALCKRHSTKGNIEAIRSLKDLTPEMRTVLERFAPSLTQAIRQCLMHGDALLRTNALELVRWFEDFSQVPTLLSLLENKEFHERDVVRQVIGELINRLYDHLQFGKNQPAAAETPPTAPAAGFLRDATRIRHQVLASLESASHRYEAHDCPEVVLGLLVLGDPESLSVKKLFRDASEACRQAIDLLLQTSTHPGVLMLIVQSMAQAYPHASVLRAFETREDPEFVCHLLRTWPRKPTQVQQKNFKVLKSIAWLQPDRLNLEVLPPGLQKPLVDFAQAIGLPAQHRLAVMEWMLMHGCPDGRTAATEVLVGLENSKVHEVIIEGLDSQEPQIQAWATSQLRAREVPHTFELLIGRLDSPIPEVQDAARAELDDFNMGRVLEMYEHLDAKTCLAVGRLVQKIDPQAIDKLKTEIRQPIQRKRIRAARAAQALGLQEQALDALLVMVQDSDTLVRRTAIEVLATTLLPASVEALSEALKDPSPRVRDAAAKALQQLRLLQQTDDSAAAKPPEATPLPEEAVGAGT